MNCWKLDIDNCVNCVNCWKLDTEKWQIYICIVTAAGATVVAVCLCNRLDGRFLEQKYSPDILLQEILLLDILPLDIPAPDILL